MGTSGWSVRPVGMDVDGQVPPDHREEGFQLRIVVGGIGVLVLGGLVQLLAIFHGLAQALPDDGGGGHTGDGGLVPVVIHLLGVLPQGQLHGSGSL